MNQLSEAWLAHQRARFTRPDAHRWWRCDAARYRRFDLRLQRDGSYDDYKAFNPDQPRVPAGSSEGGQWTSEGEGVNDRPISSDTAVEPIGAGADFAQVGTQITYGDGALTGIERVDKATIALTNTLARVMDTVGIVPGLSPQAYGRLVHAEFALAVQFQRLPGIEVETTFSLEPDAYYGSKDSIRTDVVLRNEVGDVIAVYDVKTGDKGLNPSRVRELRAKTGAVPGAAVIQLHISRGPSLKYLKPGFFQVGS